MIHTALKILSGMEIDRAMIKGDHDLIINSIDHYSGITWVITVTDSEGVTNLPHYKNSRPEN